VRFIPLLTYCTAANLSSYAVPVGHPNPVNKDTCKKTFHLLRIRDTDRGKDIQW